MIEKNTTLKKVVSGIVILAVLAGGILVGMSLSSRKDSAITAATGVESTCVVSRRNLNVSISESGEMQSQQYVDITSKVRGSVAITSVVPEGTLITKEDVESGKILCELDTSDLTERISQQEISFAAAESSYINAQEAYQIQLKQNESDIKAAELVVKFGLMDLEKYLGEELAGQIVETAGDPNTEQEVISGLIEGMIQDPNDQRWSGAALQARRELQSAIKLASQQLEKNSNQLRGTEKLHAKDYVAASELERDRLAYSSSVISLESAKTEMELFLAYDFAKEVEKLYSDYQEAGRQLVRAQARARSLEAQTMARLKGAEATYNLQQQRLKRYKDTLAACVIRAPAEGMVVYGSGGSYRRREPIEVGTTVYERQLIVRIPNMNKMAVKVQVHESWIDKVKVGQPARITVDPFPDMEFTGKVAKISLLPDAQYRWIDTSLKVYITTVDLDSTIEGVRPGMSAKVEIMLDQLEDVLCVPVQAVVNREGFKACYVVTADGLELRPVKTGAFNDSFIHITEGLIEGEVVSLAPPPLIEDDESETESAQGGGDEKVAANITTKTDSGRQSESESAQ